MEVLGKGTEQRPAKPRLSSLAEASGFLVGPAVFKTVERVHNPLAGSIPVRLRSGTGSECHSAFDHSGPRAEPSSCGAGYGGYAPRFTGPPAPMAP